MLLATTTTTTTTTSQTTEGKRKRKRKVENPKPLALHFALLGFWSAQRNDTVPRELCNFLC